MFSRILITQMMSIAALCRNVADAIQTLEQVEKATSEVGLHISRAKTKIENTGSGPALPNRMFDDQILIK